MEKKAIEGFIIILVMLLIVLVMYSPTIYIIWTGDFPLGQTIFLFIVNSLMAGVLISKIEES